MSMILLTKIDKMNFFHKHQKIQMTAILNYLPEILKNVKVKID